MIYIFYILLFLSIYPYFVYPILLFILSKLIKTKSKSDDNFEPELTIVLSVYNEESLIEDCLMSIQLSNYNQDKIKILIGSDGSDDNTINVIKNYIKKTKSENIKYFEFDRSGKNLVLNKLLPHVKTDYVIYMDADIRITKDAIKNSIKFMIDEKVGIVISRMKQVDFDLFKFNFLESNFSLQSNNSNLGLMGDSLYQSYEHYLRLWSSNISTSVNSLGAFYIMKMELYKPIPNEKVCDDYYTVLTTLANRKKVMYNDYSVVFEVRKKQITDEMNRRVRLTAGGLSTLQAKPEVLNPIYGFASLFTWSNKLLRYFTPIFFIIALLMSYTLLKNNIELFYYRTIFEGLLILFVFSTIFDKLHTNLNVKINFKLFKIYRYFILMNLGYLLGIYEFIKGKHNSKWGHSI